MLSSDTDGRQALTALPDPSSWTCCRQPPEARLACSLFCTARLLSKSDRWTPSKHILSLSFSQPASLSAPTRSINASFSVILALLSLTLCQPVLASSLQLRLVHTCHSIALGCLLPVQLLIVQYQVTVRATRAQREGRFLYILDGALTAYSPEDVEGGVAAPVPPCILPVGNNTTQVSKREGVCGRGAGGRGGRAGDMEV